MASLQIEGEEHKGQENAMVVAATQNSRLLKVRACHMLHKYPSALQPVNIVVDDTSTPATMYRYDIQKMR